jgi:CRISPR/Cas system-associated exonuclease Cas4 (RecB family)
LQAFEKKRNVRMKGVELNLAFDHTFKPVDYRDPNVFIKGKIDYAAITDTFVGIIGDHKTGKAKPLEEHYFQLYIYLVLLDVNFPEIKSAQGFIHQVGDSELKWTDPITKEKLLSLRSWIVKTFNSQAPRLQKVKDLQPEPMVSWKCRFCGFAQDCPPGLIEIKKRQKTTTDPNI